MRPLPHAIFSYGWRGAMTEGESTMPLVTTMRASGKDQRQRGHGQARPGPRRIKLSAGRLTSANSAIRLRHMTPVTDSSWPPIGRSRRQLFP